LQEAWTSPSSFFPSDNVAHAAGPQPVIRQLSRDKFDGNLRVLSQDEFGHYGITVQIGKNLPGTTPTEQSPAGVPWLSAG
jgi:hypothetical protein